MKNILLILVFLAAGNIRAQKNIIEIASLFTENAWGDISLQDSENKALKLDYYLKDKVLYRKENDIVISSIALADIDFSREFIYENALEIVSGTKKSPYDMSIYSLKPKKIKGFSLTFEFEGDAKSAFEYLKRKAQNPDNELVLTSDFATQLEQIICSASSNFEPIKGELYVTDNKYEKKYRSKVELDGSLVTKISDGAISMQYGDFENEAAAVKAYNLLREKINGAVITCCKLSAPAFSDYNPDLKGALGLWNIHDLKGLADKTAMLQLNLFNNTITLSVVISSPDDDDDW